MILTMGLAERHRHKRRAMKHCAHEFAAIQQHANYLNLKWLRARRLKYLAARDDFFPDQFLEGFRCTSAHYRTLSQQFFPDLR